MIDQQASYEITPNSELQEHAFGRAEIVKLRRRERATARRRRI
jgi:hypothetical protein